MLTARGMNFPRWQPVQQCTAELAEVSRGHSTRIRMGRAERDIRSRCCLVSDVRQKSHKLAHLKEVGTESQGIAGLSS
jgi:hypothetical protein